MKDDNITVNCFASNNASDSWFGDMNNDTNKKDKDNMPAVDNESDDHTSDSDESEYINRKKTDKLIQEYMDLDPNSFKDREKDFSLYEFVTMYKYSRTFLENTNEMGFDTNTESNSNSDTKEAPDEDSDACAHRKKRCKIFSDYPIRIRWKNGSKLY